MAYSHEFSTAYQTLRDILHSFSTALGTIHMIAANLEERTFPMLMNICKIPEIRNSAKILDNSLASLSQSITTIHHSRVKLSEILDTIRKQEANSLKNLRQLLDKTLPGFMNCVTDIRAAVHNIEAHFSELSSAYNIAVEKNLATLTVREKQLMALFPKSLEGIDEALNNMVRLIDAAKKI